MIYFLVLVIFNKVAYLKIAQMWRVFFEEIELSIPRINQQEFHMVDISYIYITL